MPTYTITTKTSKTLSTDVLISVLRSFYDVLPHYVQLSGVQTPVSSDLVGVNVDWFDQNTSDHTMYFALDELNQLLARRGHQFKFDEKTVVSKTQIVSSTIDVKTSKQELPK